MIEIDNNRLITIHRGDTFNLSIPINLGTAVEPSIYMLQTQVDAAYNDKVYLGIVEPNRPFECAIIKKTATKTAQGTDGCVTFSFKADDTLYLVPGVYYYEVKLQRFIYTLDSGESGEEYEIKVDTILPRLKFMIME